MKKILLFILLLQVSTVALARMYQWVDPDTGTTQLSGKPPSWYRSEAGGPRVFVFENGRLVDDTGIVLSAMENERLRQQALLRAEQDRQAAMEKLLQAKRQKAALDMQRRQDPQVVAEFPAGRDSEARPDDEGPPPPAGPTVEEMRALLEQYDRLRTLEARQLLDE